VAIEIGEMDWKETIAVPQQAKQLSEAKAKFQRAKSVVKRPNQPWKRH
jgi:hypothetical protein